MVLLLRDSCVGKTMVFVVLFTINCRVLLFALFTTFRLLLVFVLMTENCEEDASCCERKVGSAGRDAIFGNCRSSAVHSSRPFICSRKYDSYNPYLKKIANKRTLGPNRWRRQYSLIFPPTRVSTDSPALTLSRTFLDVTMSKEASKIAVSSTI